MSKSRNHVHFTAPNRKKDKNKLREVECRIYFVVKMEPEVELKNVWMEKKKKRHLKEFLKLILLIISSSSSSSGGVDPIIKFLWDN